MAGESLWACIFKRSARMVVLDTCLSAIEAVMMPAIEDIPDMDDWNDSDVHLS